MSEYRLGDYGIIMKGDEDLCQYDEPYEMISELNKLQRQLSKREDDYRKLRERSDEQIEGLKDNIESYKYDNQVLIDTISDCLNKMSSRECFDVLTQVVEHYEQLKEKGE